MYNLKKKFVVDFLACLSIVLLSSPQALAATYVSGVITTDTTWTKRHSPYIVTGNLGIEKNVTLTIEPGVEVLFDDDYYIGTKGKIIADGTENDIIIFDSNKSLSWDECGWSGIKFVEDTDGSNSWKGSIFNYVRISHAWQGISSYSWFLSKEIIITIKNSIFINIGREGIYIVGIPCLIENNYFSKLSTCAGMAYAINIGPESLISRNVIENSGSSGMRCIAGNSMYQKPIFSTNRVNNISGIGIDAGGAIVFNNLIINNYTGIISYSDEISLNTVYNNSIGIWGSSAAAHNNIFSNVIYNFRMSSDNNIDISNNWWGTTNQTEINAAIYDYYDDFTLGKVNYSPFLTSIEPNAPIPSPFDFHVIKNQDSVELSWNPVNVSDIKGYKIYYDLYPDYPYNGTGADQGSSPIDVGNVNNFSISGLPAGIYYFTVTSYDTFADGIDDQIEGHESWYSTLSDPITLHLSPVYRFWSNVFMGHFYTISETEKNYVIDTWPETWTYEGPVFYAFTTQVPGTSPVYRFWSNVFMGHFYTIRETEKNIVIDTWPDTWTYEGPVFYAFTTKFFGTFPIYRFWSNIFTGHFYTISETEKNYVIDTWPETWTYEGPSFFAYPLQ